MVNSLEIDNKIRLIRTERYACQSVARKILPNERVSKCLRIPNNRNHVEVWRHQKTDKAFYNGLIVCGSVWHCPVCAAKISERRKKELQQAFSMHQAEGGKIAFLTLTFRHSRDDRLDDLLKSFGQATQNFMSGYMYNKIRKKMDLIGRIRALEVTYSFANGWHPHAHILLFYRNEVDLKLIEQEMFDLYSKACQKVGLDVLEDIGLKLKDGKKANNYMAKYGSWSIEQEMTKSHIKKAKKDSFTPFDFLREYLQKESLLYKNLFENYANAFKGKRQLQWSQGLKKHFLIGEKSDEEVAKEKVEEADLLGTISLEDWKQILKNDDRSKLLDFVEKFGFDGAIKLLIKKDTPIECL